MAARGVRTVSNGLREPVEYQTIGTVGEGSTAPQSGRRVTVDEAARHLGLTVDAVRKRVQRDQIPHEKDPAGRVRIILDSDQTIRDEVRTDARDELVESLQDQVRFLREELARKDAILLRMAESIPQLEAPPTEASEAPVTDVSPGPMHTPTDAGGGPQEGTQRPWWRRMFGGG